MGAGSVNPCELMVWHLAPGPERVCENDIDRVLRPDTAQNGEPVSHLPDGPPEAGHDRDERGCRGFPRGSDATYCHSVTPNANKVVVTHTSAARMATIARFMINGKSA